MLPFTMKVMPPNIGFSSILSPGLPFSSLRIRVATASS
jgi:hypothetical protein